MASFRKRGSKWQFRIQYKDVSGETHQIQEGGFSTKAMAANAARDYETKLSRGADPVNDDIMFIDYWDKWIEAYKSGDKSSNTEYRYRLLRSHLSREFAGRSLKSIKPMEWQTFLNDFSEGKDLKKPHTRSRDIVSKMNGYVRSMVKSAINNQLIYTDFTYGATIRGEKSSSKIKVLQAADFAAVKRIAAERAHASSSGAVAVYIASMTGLRVSEVLALQWTDIDEQAGVVHVTKSWDYHRDKDFAPTKTESSIRDVEVSPAFFEVMARVHREQAERNIKTGYRDDLGLVLRTYMHTVPTDAACNKALKTIEDHAGIPDDKQITFHGLRHSHVSYLIAQGVDIYYISKRLGHADVSITLKVYGHLLDDQRSREAAKALSALDAL